MVWFQENERQQRTIIFKIFQKQAQSARKVKTSGGGSGCFTFEIYYSPLKWQWKT